MTPRRKLVHDRLAERDLTGIYTYRTWGARQADHYLDLLETSILSLVAQPESGQPRDDLRSGYWSIRVQHHIVFYTYDDSEIRVRRVLHESMDWQRHL